MYGLVGAFDISAAVVHGNNNTCTAGNAHKKVYQQVDDCAGRAANCGKGCLAHKVAHNNGVNSVVKLLKKCAEPYRQKKQHNVFVQTAFKDFILFHKPSLNQI